MAACACMSIAALSVGIASAGSVLIPGDVVAVCGDSITMQNLYSAYLEDYLLACGPVREVKTMQCGWAGATVTHFAGHMKSDILTLSPTVATTSYGMNDGGYAAADPANEKNYRDGLTKVVQSFKQAGTRVIIIGSPGVVDSYYFKNPKHPAVTAKAYNETLARLGNIGQEIAQSNSLIFADVHTLMMEAMAKAKARLGRDYPVAGGNDGVHPGPSGHLLMAYAYLRAMGFDGNIGSITYDATAGTATATGGHRVISSDAHQIVIESSRYPFCFFRGTKDPDTLQAADSLDDWPYGNAAILPFIPFNEDLNRFTLTVKNLKSRRIRITWGDQSKEFTSGQLAGGINLAAEFLKNPFVKPFMELHRAVEYKQVFETTFIRDYLSDKESSLRRSLPSKMTSIRAVETGFRDIHEGLLENCAQTVKPVTHTIKIEELP
jgi:lysophospholipase L1-like esterase